MSEWREVRLDNVLEVKYGKNHKKLQDGLVPCYGTGGIMRYVNDELYNKESILIPRKGSLNNIYYLDKPFWTVDTLFWTKIKKEPVVAKFLFYQLTLIDFTILNVGSAVPSLTVPVLNEIDISLPPLPEQKAIAEVLSSLDDKIDLLHRQNKTLEQMAETLFRQWFVEEAGEDATLGDIIDFNPEHWYYRDLTSGMKFQNGDSIIARITPCLENGKTSYIAFLEDGQVGWGSTEYIVMRMKEPFHKFISYLISKDNDFRDFAISSMSGSSGRQRAQATTIQEYEFKIPTGEVIKKLNEQLDPIVKKLLYNARQIPTLESLRDTLLPKLMSGEIQVAL